VKSDFLTSIKKSNFLNENNLDRAESYADVVKHNTVYFSNKPSILKWIHKKRFKSILTLMGDISDKIILDAGSGEGYFLSQIKAKEKYGIEISKKRVVRSQEILNDGKITIGDITNLPFKNQKFDLIICSEVLEHVKNYPKAIKEFKRCLKPNGHLILSFPNEQMVGLVRLLIFRFPIHEPDHINRINNSEVKKFISKSFIENHVPINNSSMCLYQVYKIKSVDLVD